MSAMPPLTTEEDTPAPPPVSSARSARRPWWRRRLLKRSTIWLHRWAALVLGLVLLAVTTSGAVVLYKPEFDRWQHRDLYAAQQPVGQAAAQGQLTLAQAVDIGRAHDPAFTPGYVYDAHGTYVLENYEAHRRIMIDPASRQILGDYDFTRHDGALDWTMGLMYNLHLCALSCEGEPGYQAWLAAEVPGSQWAGFEDTKITWGGLILGVMALLLLLLSLSGIWLWWPGLKRWVHGVRVRLRKGRYARDYDLHQVAGMLALPFLLLWAVTGAGFEFGFVGKAWYAALPGEDQHVDYHSAAAADPAKPPPDITAAAAVAAARQRLGGNWPLTGFVLPPATDATAPYEVWFSEGYDPYHQMDWPGNTAVGVDRRTGTTEITYRTTGQPVTAQIWQSWNFPTHAGYVVGPWWRLFWLVLGLVPLLLAVTGLSTWLYKRSVRKRRRTTATGLPQSAPTEPDQAEAGRSPESVRA